MQLFDWSTTARKVAVMQEQCRNQKQCSKWPSPALTHDESWRHCWTATAMMAWSSLAHSVLMGCLSSSRSLMRVLYTFYCSMFPHFSQLNLNPANLETTVQAEWILAFRFPAMSTWQGKVATLIRWGGLLLYNSAQKLILNMTNTAKENSKLNG